jgi:Arc/MetJ-type ribon-helix-helix transcriptional regulator
MENMMISTDATTIKVSTKDSILIDRFVELGEFKSRGEFVIFSIKKTINELLLKEFGEKAYSMAQLSDKDVDNLLTEIKNIRKRLWSEYATRLS